MVLGYSVLYSVSTKVCTFSPENVYACYLEIYGDGGLRKWNFMILLILIFLALVQNLNEYYT